VLLKTLLALQAAQMPFDTRHVLAINVPVMTYGRTPNQVVGFYKEAIRRIREIPGVTGVAVGTAVPWRDAGSFGFGLGFSADGHVRAGGEEDPRARFRIVSPGYFAALGVPMIAGRDFNEGEQSNSEPVVIVSKTLAEKIFPHQEVLNRHIYWTDPVTKFIDVSSKPRRIVGIAADVDDESVVPGPVLTVYHPLGQQELWGGRMFVHSNTDPYPLVPKITSIVRRLSVDQPVEHAATLQDIRAEVLTPDRLNALVFGGFAAVALVIAVVGVAGVLAFSVSGRTREFGIRMAIGSQQRQLVQGVLQEGLIMALTGVATGAICGFILTRMAGSYLFEVRIPGPLPVLGSAGLLLIAAITASAIPAMRAARVDVMQALRAD
jgi:predicted permease